MAWAVLVPPPGIKPTPAISSPIRDQTHPPLQWKRGVLTVEPPGESPIFLFLKNQWFIMAISNSFHISATLFFLY